MQMNRVAEMLPWEMFSLRALVPKAAKVTQQEQGSELMRFFVYFLYI